MNPTITPTVSICCRCHEERETGEVAAAAFLNWRSRINYLSIRLLLRATCP